MPILMIGGWIAFGRFGLWYNPVSGLQRFLCHAIMSIAMVQKGLEPNGCKRSTLVKNRHKTDIFGFLAFGRSPDLRRSHVY